ncbi:Uncharacterized protein BM_BM9773 [Brugia malayi]|uniref:Bm9773 n=1 Tax=Brugia malayi TaxID=6279 RepID=A0A4E9FKN5_BRUMA|nr:Uncharacterized protein BM_BM9773 [Brugia malayi]VIO97062.1 Uncharacterized protein BM_BM9773 [Brugia malayi]
MNGSRHTSLIVINIDELREKLERSEYGAHSEGATQFPKADLKWRPKLSAISRTSRNVLRVLEARQSEQEKMEEIPAEELEPALVHGDDGMAIHSDVIPGAPAIIPERMVVETGQENVL